MTRATLYPRANRTAQWFADAFPGTVFTSMEKLLLHSTEGSGWPAYQGGAIAPNMTGFPNMDARRIDWRQHWPVNESSRALMHTQTQPTNGDHVFQVELIGTCVPGGPGLYWPGAPDWALQDIADLYAWLNSEWDIPIQSSVSWRAYNASGDWQRLSNAAYDAYRGLLAHEHAPQNDHRDIGNLNAARIVQFALGGTVSETNPTLTEIKQGILYYEVQDAQDPTKTINVKTEIDRTYALVSKQSGVLAAIQQAEAAGEVVDIDALAHAIVVELPQVVVNNIDPAVLSSAVADKLAARLQA